MKINFHIVLVLLLFVSTPFLASAQKKKGKRKTKNTGVMNLQKFDRQKVHFGFLLGYNKAGYDFRNNFSNDTISILEVEPTPGFNIGLISVLHFNKNMKLKFMPNVAFQRRDVEYTFDERFLLVDNNKDLTQTKPIESTIIEFPLLFKLRTNRIDNFAAALLIGGSYGIDIASQKNVVDLTVLRANDQILSAEAGVGLDFFLQYFKLGLELKYAHGFNDLLISDAPSYSVYSSPIDYFKSRVWTFSITFEGSW